MSMSNVTKPILTDTYTVVQIVKFPDSENVFVEQITKESYLLFIVIGFINFIQISPQLTMTIKSDVSQFDWITVVPLSL